MKCVLPSCQGEIQRTQMGAVCDTCGATNIFALRAAGEVSSSEPPEPAPKIVLTYKQWKDGTYVRTNISGRSSALKQLDKALKAFLEQPTNATLFAEVEKYFANWKQGRSDWRKSSRNRSGMVTKLDEYLTQEAGNVGRQANTNRFIESEADKQRLGVLYLLGNTMVANNTQAYATQIFSSSLSVANSTGITQNVHAFSNPLSGGVNLPSGNKQIPHLNKSANEIFNLQNGAKTGDAAASDKFSDARGFNFKKDPKFDLQKPPSSSNAMHTLVDDLRDRAAKKGVSEVSERYNTQGASSIPCSASVNSLLQKIKQKLLDLGDSLLSMLKTSVRAMAKMAIKTGIDALIKKIFNIAVPLGGPVLGVLEEGYKGLVALKQRWKVSGLLNRAKIKPGHAAIMIKAVYDEIAQDAWNALKGIASNVLDGTIQFFTAGLGVIATIVKSAVFAIIDVVKMFRDVTQTNIILEEAKEHWLAHSAFRKNGSQPSDANDLIYRDAEKFNEWFSKVCDKSTPLAVLCFNSGICTNLFTALDTEASGESQTQLRKDFDETQKAMAYVKQHGVKYLKNSKVKISSPDAYVNQTILRVQSGGILS